MVGRLPYITEKLVRANHTRNNETIGVFKLGNAI